MSKKEKGQSFYRHSTAHMGALLEVTSTGGDLGLQHTLWMRSSDMTVYSCSAVAFRELLLGVAGATGLPFMDAIDSIIQAMQVWAER